MSDRLSPSVPEHGHGRRRGMSFAGGPMTEQGLRSRLRMLSAVRAVSVMAWLCAAWVVHVLAGLPREWTAVVAGLGCGVVVFAGDRGAISAARAIGEHRDRELARQRTEYQESQKRTGEWLVYYESVVAEGRKGIAWMLEQINRGECPPVPDLAVGEGPTGDVFADFATALRQVKDEALHAVAAAAARRHLPGEAAAVGDEAGRIGPEQAEVLVYIAQRLHTLVSRTLAALSALENVVEDPDLLHGVFVIDHLVTQTRRAVESLAVLGGKTPRLVIKPILVSTVLRQSVAEIEQYKRVRVPHSRLELALPGYAGPDVIHLLAELVENGTKFSPGTTQVLMRASEVPAGLAIEVEDRGNVPMSPQKMAQMNRLLAAPEAVNLRDQLKSGQIGLLVAARLAQRHGIKIELRPNLLGGTQALVVLPHNLLVAPERPKPLAPPSGPAGALLPEDASGSGAMAGHSQLDLPDPAATPAARAGQGDTLLAGPDTAPLPQRRRSTGSSGEPDAGPAAEQGPQGGSRPPLPQRSAAPRTVDPLASTRRHGSAAPAGPATAGLMASYTAGVRRGVEETDPHPPQPSGPAQ
ncbi:ATP-binding protein [Streptomyces sp. NPDC059373]